MIKLRAAALVTILAVAFTAQAQPVSEFRLDRVRQSLTGTHRHYRQFINGIEVVGGERAETLLPAGEIRVDFDRSARLPASRVSAEATIAAASKAGLVYVNVDGQARLARRVIVEERRLEPHARYLDAVTGVVLRDEPLFYTAKGRVFDVNPVARLNDPSLRDDDDSAAAVPAAAYSEVDLPGLAPSGLLSGPNVQIVDIEAPFTPRADASQSLDFDRSQPQFEEVNAYFQIDRAQRYLQSLGYTGARQLVAYSIPVDAHAANGTDNSYYIEGSPPGRGTLYFGDGGTEDAEDSDIMLHEFGHAIHDWIIPGALTGPSSSQARALSEGFGDYWSFSSTYAPTIASGRDPFCIADWDARCAGDDPSRQCGYPAGADCLRRVDSTKTIADFINSNDAGTEHKNGMIWSSALREIFMTLVRQLGVDQGKRIADTIVLESLFGLPPGPDFRTVAQSMITADRQLRNGSEVDLICSAMTARGIFSAGDCGNAPRGEWTLFQSPDRQAAIPDGTGSMTSSLTIGDTRAIAKVAVRVDIAHASRGDLVITLVAPNGTTVKLKDSSQTDRTPDVHATFGVDAPTVDPLDAFNGQSAGGTWNLVVSDVYAGDVGVLQGWNLLIDFAGDAPAVTRPSTSLLRRIIPAVAHATGAAGTAYTSDLYLLNRGSRTAELMMIFTPAGADGTSAFAAEKVSIAAAQGIALHDVVSATFGITGVGSLEIQGDLSSIVATSVTSNATPAGTVAQAIPALPAEAAAGAGDPLLYAFPVVTSPSARTNAGAVETSGAAGTVRVTLLRPGGEAVSSVDVPIAPFSQIQMPVLSADAWDLIEFAVVSGNARILAYESLVDPRSGDAMFVPATAPTAAPQTITLPAVGHAAGGGAMQWDTELWYATPGASSPNSAWIAFYPADSATPPAVENFPSPTHTSAVVPQVFRIDTNAIGQIDAAVPAGALIVARTYTPGSGRGTVGDRAGAAVSSSSTLDVVHVESTPAARTNIGLAALDGTLTVVRMTLFDDAGRVLATDTRSLAPRGSIQIPIAAIYGGIVTNGRVRFEVMSGGRIAGYASVVDNKTQDPVIIPAE